MCLVRSIVANLRHFNALDYIVCRSEEVRSFFWCSVYMTLVKVCESSPNISQQDSSFQTLFNINKSLSTAFRWRIIHTAILAHIFVPNYIVCESSTNIINKTQLFKFSCTKTSHSLLHFIGDCPHGNTCSYFCSKLHDRFAQVCESSPNTSHQDFISTSPCFTFLVLLTIALKNLHLEHDLQEIPQVPQELYPARERPRGKKLMKIL